MVSYKASLEKAQKIIKSRKCNTNNTCNITSNSSAEAAYMLNLFFSQAMMNCGNYNFPKSGSSVKSTDKNSDETSAVPLGKGKDAPPENVENDNEENLSLEEKKNKVVDLIKTKRKDFNAEPEIMKDLVSKYDLYKSCHDWDEDKIADRLNLYLKALEAHKTELKYGEIAQMDDKEKAVQEMAKYNIVDEDIKGAMEKKNQDGTVMITNGYLNALKNRGVGYLDLYDTNGDEKISFDEFCALEAKDSGITVLGAEEKAISQEYFNMMDKSGDGNLDANEMASHLFAVSRLYDGEDGQPKNSADDIRFMEWYGAQNPELSEYLSQASDILYNALKQPPQIKFNKEELQIKIDNIKTKLGSVLKGKTFNAPNGKTVSGEDLLKILDNINFENNDYGAARADKSTSQILINLNGTYSSNSDAEIMKIILHEALHCLYQDTKIITWEEERCCESQALALTAEIVQAEKTNPSTTFTSYSAYGQNIENFTNNTDLLNGVINNWLETGYANRPKNAQGDITILKDSSLTSPQVLSTGSREYLNPNNRIEIQSGDEIYIDGKLETNIGEAILESAKLTNNGNSNKFQLYIPSENYRMLGIVAFDGCVDHTEAPTPNITARTIEIKRNGEVVCTGKIY